MTSTQLPARSKPLTNYVAYHDPRLKQDAIGHYDLVVQTVEPLSFVSGVPVSNLYQVIELGEDNIISGGVPYPIDNVKILPPLPGRDVLCVGKNYAEHAKEFNNSGFDSSDRVDTPSHPVIFTKRFTSIIACGEEIFPHPDFTRTLDYEGEIGVIIGKPGFRISKEDAMNHVWGYTIVNDVTARERQRDHKQFYIGKSADTFCPMGPVAVPKTRLEKVLRVQTRVNGELRQDATTENLIFSIPHLIETISEGQTLVPGDVLATGTPAGVGLGMKPPTYLKPGDTIAVSVTGLGTLTNRVADPAAGNPTVEKIKERSYLPRAHLVDKYKPAALRTINNKPLYYRDRGNNVTNPPLVFVHGLGGTNDFFTPLIESLDLRKDHFIYAYDFEGHGLSPTSPLSRITIESLAGDLNGVFKYANISSGATVIAHDIGCLIAVQFALKHGGKVAKLVLLGPPPSPLPRIGSLNLHNTSHAARSTGMSSLVDMVANTGTSRKTRETNTLAYVAVKLSLLGQDPEGARLSFVKFGPTLILEYVVAIEYIDHKVYTAQVDLKDIVKEKEAFRLLARRHGSDDGPLI
ncbi:hypothetical protein BDU57DRAFT_537331 [Ampelomyces quisqualis]|uniref:Fumarylacetoacetate hydrolase-like protein n=1 Tax=Ampelomyces quisqualis TaxID=50730 RepID=A0A6A5QS48_AMPQU|nr:hypothetical protein BDU57DRAFT_537331 [Ampelomyces quisqualis]